MSHDDIEAHLAAQLDDIVPPTVRVLDDLSVVIEIGTESVEIPEALVQVIASSLYGLTLARFAVTASAPVDAQTRLEAFEQRILFDMADWSNSLRRKP